MTSGPFAWHQVVAATSVTNRLSAVFELLSVPITYALANWTRISANMVTRIGGSFGLVGAALFALQQPVAASLAFAAFLLLDCSDGALARLRKQESIRGANLDLWTDRAVLLVAALGFSGRFGVDGDALAAWLCLVYLAAHYLTDLGWLIAERQRAQLPPQSSALEAELRAKRPRPLPQLGQLYLIERSFAPVPWVCNGVFLVGTGLAGRIALILAIAALGWYLLVPRLATAARRAL
jgi:phosphatidylglycerophosphate synthase